MTTVTNAELKTLMTTNATTTNNNFKKVKQALAGKVDYVSGKGLSTKDFTAALETKLNALPTNAELQSGYVAKDGSKVLISEACTHHRQCNDIGTVKFPKWLKEYTGKDLEFEFTQGGEFPKDLYRFDIIIHCGGCMINEAEMKTRQKRAKEQNIPMVNYGMAIAYMNGILERALKVFK